jgi:hypothetical protein
LKNLKAENCPYFHLGGKDPPTKINYMTGTGEYLSQVSLPELDTDLLSEDEVAFIEIHYHQLQNSTQNFSVQRGMIHT